MDLGRDSIYWQESTTSVLPLPDVFLEFLDENGLDSSIYVGLDSIPRYIRLKPGHESQLTEIKIELDGKLQEVDWLPGFFLIPPHIQIARTNAYRSGKIYGMDAASGAAVMALNVTCGDHVLDLCAAPELMKVDSAEMWRCRSGGIPKTLRFDPKTSQISGLFIAKFTKIAA